MPFENILFAREGPVATITLNRPDTYNALAPNISSEMMAALEMCRKEQEIRAVVLTGSGKAFCSGGDIKYFEQFAGSNPAEPVRRLLEPLHRIVMDIRQMPKPVLAAINGAVGGAGMSLALSCDLRIASRQAKFKQAYTSLGLTPDVGWSLWVGLLAGFGKASEMIFLDPVYDAEQAQAMGLVHRVVEQEELMTASSLMAEQLARGATQSFAIAKAGLNHAFLTLLERQLEVERQGVLSASLTGDYQEGLEAFLTKRKPSFKGF
ncbi:MAG TPA: 2-(1,2-epoxy-1,2-dihydrophenyl)acetyl-CoA isomerase [Pelotomaculum sp.]|nr:2-(1,2-epoxy-1,2-dihydrophenyl)acetyl-CoA isomerase [Pelotomaculum sp.]